MPKALINEHHQFEICARGIPKPVNSGGVRVSDARIIDHFGPFPPFP